MKEDICKTFNRIFLDVARRIEEGDVRVIEVDIEDTRNINFKVASVYKEKDSMVFPKHEPAYKLRPSETWEEVPLRITYPKNFKHNGETCQEASLRLGGGEGLVRYRLRTGWDVDKAFTTPPDERFQRKGEWKFVRGDKGGMDVHVPAGKKAIVKDDVDAKVIEKNLVIEFFMEWMRENCPTFEERFDPDYFGDTNNLEEYLRYYGPFVYLDNAFDWKLTKEGELYWIAKDEEWVDSYMKEFRGEKEK